MEYHTVFEVGKLAYKATEIGFILLVWFALGCSGFIIGKATKWKRQTFKKASFAFVFVSFICGTLFATQYNDYRKIEQLLKTQGPQIAEGLVSDFRAYPDLQTDKAESFCVKEVCFKYPCCETIAGFTEMRREGSPIHDGLPVRVTYIDSATITKLEVGQEH